MMKPIYLDYNATTPIDSAVTEAMQPYLREHFGNPSSSHVFGRAAHEAVDRARSQVAELLGVETEEIVFTSGGSEANNQALLGPIFRSWHNHDSTPADWHLITSAIEHPAILQPCAFLQRLGCKLTTVPVDRYGLVDPGSVRRAIGREQTIISIMHSNNEVGTLQPIGAIAAIAREQGAIMHTDAAQSVGKAPVNARELGVDLLSVAGHKVYAPKGVGVLYVRRSVLLEPLIHGAGHEKGRRAGTENVPYLVGLGKACEMVRQTLPNATRRLKELRDHLWQRLQSALGERIARNGHPEQCLPNTLNVNFLGRIGAELLAKVPEVAASTGSACHEGEVRLSPVLQAMGVSPEAGRGAVRLTMGRYTTMDEIDRAAEMLIAQASRGGE